MYSMIGPASLHPRDILPQGISCVCGGGGREGGGGLSPIVGLCLLLLEDISFTIPEICQLMLGTSQYSAAWLQRGHLLQLV